MVEARKIVTVTGITGFVGLAVAAELLKHGVWKIRGTVRSINNSHKIEPLQKVLGRQFSSVELVEADLLDLESLKRAFSGSTYVIHVASPFVIEEPDDPQTIIKPAVEGTKNVMLACKENGVKRVSITSSIVAVASSPPEGQPDVLDESCWSDPDYQLGAFEKSKTLAERAAWDFVAAQPEGEKLELTTVCPGFILGPTMVNKGFASGQAIKMFMENGFPGGSIPQIQFGIVDVREVALAHVRCIERDAAQGQRFLLFGQTLWFREVAVILEKHYASQGYIIPTVESKYCLVKIFSLFSRRMQAASRFWGREFHGNNSRSKNVLGIEYRPARDSIIEMVD